MKRFVLALLVALVAIAAVAQPSSPIGTRPLNTKPWWSPTIINVKDYNCKGDGHTDDTLCLQRAVNAAAVVAALGNGPGFVYLPATGRYAGYVFSSLVVNGDVFFVGVLPGDGSLDFGGTLICTSLAANCITMNSTTWGFENLIFRYFAGWGGNVTGTTSSTITFDTLVTPDMTQMQATILLANFTNLAQWGYYTDNVDVFRNNSVNQILGATPPSIATVPNDGAAHTVAGISWTYVAHGSTFTAGDFGWGQQWYYFGSTANSITGVVPAPGQLTYADPTLVNQTNIARGYFASLQPNFVTPRTTAMIFGSVGQDPVIKNCWFNGMAGIAVNRSASMQGGIWSENVFDLGQYGISGDLTNAKITNSRFFGQTQSAITTTSTPALGVGGGQITDNFFQLNSVAIYLDDGGTYTTATVTGSAIADMVIRNNYSNQDRAFLNARGVAHLTVESNRVSRTGGHPFLLNNVAFSRFVDNHVNGCGEQPTSASARYDYMHIQNMFSNNLIAGNTFSYLNAGQASSYAIDMLADGGSKVGNIVQENQYYLTGVALLVANYNAATGTLPIFANNAAALAGGLTAGLKYRTGGDPDIIAIVH